MKFLHAADIHLDSPLLGLRARADIPDDVTRHCTRRAFSALIDLALAEDVAFIIIAGDLFDGDWKDFSTGLFFAAEMRRLGRPCFLLRGNHDARSVITRNLTLPPNAHEFSSRTCETKTLPELGIALHGHSFPNRAVPEDLSANYPPPVAGMLNIGVLHTSAEDPGEHETYAPCSVAALTLKGYAYWALGHIHVRRVLSERPWIVFPGNTQGRHPKETGPKGCTLVTMEDRRIVAVAHRDLDVLRWASLDVDVTGADDAELMRLLGDRVRATIAAAAGRPVLARVTLSGESPIHAMLAGETERIAAECRNIAIEADGALYLESMRLRTRAEVAAGDDWLAPLQASFASGLDDPGLVAALLKQIAEVRQRVPAHGREGLDLPEDEAGLRALAGDAWRIAADALATGRGG